MRNKNFQYPVTRYIEEHNGDTWNHMCSWIITTFGLPGNNYIMELDSSRMTFKFKQKEDAMIAALRWGNDHG